MIHYIQVLPNHATESFIIGGCINQYYTAYAEIKNMRKANKRSPAYKKIDILSLPNLVSEDYEIDLKSRQITDYKTRRNAGTIYNVEFDYPSGTYHVIVKHENKFIILTAYKND